MAEKESEEIDLSVLGEEEVGSLLDVDSDASVEYVESIEDLLGEKEDVKTPEDQPKEEPPVVDDKVNDKQEEKVSPFVIFAQLLDEKGIVEFNQDEFEDSEDGLVNLVEGKINKSIERYKESLHPKIKELIEHYDDGVPIESFLEVEASIEDYESIKEDNIREDVQLQKDLVRESLSMKGFSKEQIDRKLSRFIDGGILEEEAIEAKDSIVEGLRIEKERKREIEKAKSAERAEKNKRALEDLKANIDKSDEIIKGVKITPKQKEDLYDGMTKVDRNGKTQIKKMIESDPLFGLRVAYAALVLGWDLSGIKAKAETKVAGKVKDIIDESIMDRSHKQPGGGSGGKIDWDAVKRSMNKMK